MKQSSLSKVMKALGIAVLMAGLVLSFAACKKAEGPKPAADPAAPKMKPMNEVRDEVIAALGQADADHSGAFEVDMGTMADLVTVNYHQYLLASDAFDTVFPPLIAPKIRDLYRKVKGIDKVAFDVSVPTEDPTVWKPKLHFLVTRKVVEETDWSKLLDADFFQIVLDLKHLD